jgi:hypothetical protein
LGIAALFEQGELSRSQAMAMTRKKREQVEYVQQLDEQVIMPYVDLMWLKRK